MPCHKVHILDPGMQNFGHEEWAILIHLFFHNLKVPLLSVLTVLVAVDLLACSFGGNWKVIVVVPIYSC